MSKTSSNTMKLHYFLFSLLFLSLSTPAKAQIHKAFKVNAQFVSPWYIHALSDDSLIVVDPKNQKQALQLRSVPDGKLLNSHRIGRGPGEISARGAKIINISDDGISLWDASEKQLIKYDRSLHYKTSILANIPAMQVALADDSLAFASTALNSPDFLRLYKVNTHRINSTPLRSYSTINDPVLKPLSKNYLLQQGPFLTDNNFLYLGFRYSSLIIKASTDSVVYINGKPAKIGLPIYQAKKSDGGKTVQSAPDIGKYAETTRDMAVDDNYLYVLYSGKRLKAGRFKQVWLATTGQLDKRIEDLDFSKKVFVYKKKTGTYLGLLKLPREATKIAVSAHYIFALERSKDGIPEIIAYKKGNIKEEISDNHFSQKQ